MTAFIHLGSVSAGGATIAPRKAPSHCRVAAAAAAVSPSWSSTGSKHARGSRRHQQQTARYSLQADQQPDPSPALTPYISPSPLPSPTPGGSSINDLFSSIQYTPAVIKQQHNGTTYVTEVLPTFLTPECVVLQMPAALFGGSVQYVKVAYGQQMRFDDWAYELDVSIAAAAAAAVGAGDVDTSMSAEDPRVGDTPMPGPETTAVTPQPMADDLPAAAATAAAVSHAGLEAGMQPLAAPAATVADAAACDTTTTTTSTSSSSTDSAHCVSRNVDMPMSGLNSSKGSSHTAYSSSSSSSSSSCGGQQHTATLEPQALPASSSLWLSEMTTKLGAALGRVPSQTLGLQLECGASMPTAADTANCGVANSATVPQPAAAAVQASAACGPLDAGCFGDWCW